MKTNSESLNLVKILEKCPKYTKLYSVVYGEVFFNEINNVLEEPISFFIDNKYKNSSRVTPQGKLLRRFDGECTLFPSKENRDWSTFKAPKWRAKKNEVYYYISCTLEVTMDIDIYGEIDYELYKLGNYFRTEEEAKEKLEEIKKMLNVGA